MRVKLLQQVFMFKVFCFLNCFFLNRNYDGINNNHMMV